MQFRYLKDLAIALREAGNGGLARTRVTADHQTAALPVDAGRVQEQALPRARQRLHTGVGQDALQGCWRHCQTGRPRQGLSFGQVDPAGVLVSLKAGQRAVVLDPARGGW